MPLNEVNEFDWKLFRKRIPEWQERHMGKLVNEYSAIIAGEGRASRKFWALEERLRNDVKHVGVIAELKRSRMFHNLRCLLSENAITMDDLDGFSDELKQRLAFALTV